jgi:hypothetical protein
LSVEKQQSRCSGAMLMAPKKANQAADEEVQG